VIALSFQIFLFFAFIASAFADPKIGTVDMKAVFAAYYKTKEADAQMDAARTAYRNALDEKTAAIKTLETEITAHRRRVREAVADGVRPPEPFPNADNPNLPHWQEAMRERQRFVEEEGGAIEKQIRRLRNEIVGEIMKAIDDKVKADGYDLVFDVSGPSENKVPVTLFAARTYDFTASIIETLNAGRSVVAAPVAKGPLVPGMPVTQTFPESPPSPMFWLYAALGTGLVAGIVAFGIFLRRRLLKGS
jgi:outer membrane protein